MTLGEKIIEVMFKLSPYVLLIAIVGCLIFAIVAGLSPKVEASSSNCTCQVLKEQNRILNKIERHMRDAQKH